METLRCRLYIGATQKFSQKVNGVVVSAALQWHVGGQRGDGRLECHKKTPLAEAAYQCLAIGLAEMVEVLQANANGVPVAELEIETPNKKVFRHLTISGTLLPWRCQGYLSLAQKFLDKYFTSVMVRLIPVPGYWYRKPRPFQRHSGLNPCASDAVSPHSRSPR